MIRIISLHLRNIKSHRERDFFFAGGTNVLSGRNGAGKSTLFEAIGYALFGVDAREFVSNIDRFLTIGAKKGEVRVVFSTGDDAVWQVTRTVGPASKWLLGRERDGAFEVEDHAGMAETEARIAHLLGLANGRPLAEQFRLVIGPFQNDFLGPFVIRQPTKRQEAFDEILGIDAWRRTYKGSGTMLSRLQERVRLLETDVAAREEQVAVLPEREQERVETLTRQTLLTEQIGAAETGLQEISTLLGELDRLEQRSAHLRAESRVLEGRIREGEEKILLQAQRVEESLAAQQRMEENRPGRDAFERAEAILIDLRLREQQRRQAEQEGAALESQVAMLQQKLEHERVETAALERELAEEQAQLAEARACLAPDPAVAESAARLPGLRSEMDRLKGERAELLGRRAALVEGGEKLSEGICPFLQESCPAVGGPGAEPFFASRLTVMDRRAGELDRALEQLAPRITAAEQAAQGLESARVRLQELERREQNLAGKREKLGERTAAMAALDRQQAEAAARARAARAALAGYQGLDEEIRTVEADRNRWQGARDAYAGAQALAADLEQRRQLQERMVSLMGELRERLRKTLEELQALQQTYAAERHAEARGRREALVAQAAVLAQQADETQRNLKRLEEELGRLREVQADVAQKRGLIARLGEKEKLLRFLRNQVFKNVSTRLSERFREEIGSRADRIYRTISESDEELCWGENYRIVLRDMPDGIMRERSDDQLSGGQMMSAVVSLRLALLQTIGARIAFFDEPTSNLDAGRRENLAGAFRAIDLGRDGDSGHWYDQLFLISHDVAFAEITDNLIEL